MQPERRLGDLLANRREQQRKPQTKIDQILETLPEEEQVVLVEALTARHPNFPTQYDYSSVDISESLKERGFPVSQSSVRRWRKNYTENNA